MTPAAATGVAASLGELIALRARAAGAVRAARPAPAAGNHPSGRHSRGMEFAEARPYQPGDDARCIDWRQTARRGRAYTKLFQEEHARPLWLFVDASRSMRFGTRVAFKSVLAARAAALLSWAAAATGDRAGGMVWTGGAPQIVHPRQGSHGVLCLLRHIADATAAAPPAAPGDMAAALQALQRALQPGSLVVLLSDFATMDDGAARAVAALGRRAELVIGHVYDIFESAPVPGRYRITDGHRCMALDLHDAAARAAHEAAFAARRATLRDLARQARATLLPLATDCALDACLQRAYPALRGRQAGA